MKYNDIDWESVLALLKVLGPLASYSLPLPAGKTNV
jgi:hypothetical protein